MTFKHAAGLLIGLPSITALGFVLGWKAALLIFLAMFANNLSQTDD